MSRQTFSTSALHGHDLFLLRLEQLVDFAFVALRQLLHLLLGGFGFVLGQDAALFFRVGDFVRVAAGVADPDLGFLAEPFDLVG